METQIIKAVQTRLEDLKWYAGQIDGDAGPKTQAAIVDFKRASGLNPRPFVGPVTLSMLFDDDARKRPVIINSDEPSWMIEARAAVMGLHEARNYLELAKWLRSDGATLGDPRKLPWCGDFVQTAVRRSLPKEEFIPENPYLARNWMKFGKETAPRLGAVLVFWRGSRSGISGHVGFYVGEDASTYHVLGGNQSNAVTVARISKNRLLGARWPSTDSSETRAQQLAAVGAVSTNEA